MDLNEAVRAAIEAYKAEPDGEPLDGDEVSRLTEHFRNAALLAEGCITEDEYDCRQELATEKAAYDDKHWGVIWDEARQVCDDTMLLAPEPSVAEDAWESTVVFDLDDTLFDQAEMIRSLVRRRHSLSPLLGGS